MFASAALIGDYRHAGFLLRPELRGSYFHEETDAYTDSLGVGISSVSIDKGQISLDPNLSYRYVASGFGVIEPSLSLKGIYTFGDRSGVTSSTEDQLVAEGLRARLEAGLGVLRGDSLSVRAEGFFDGIGAEDFEGYGGKLNFSYSFSAD